MPRRLSCIPSVGESRGVFSSTDEHHGFFRPAAGSVAVRNTAASKLTRRTVWIPGRLNNPNCHPLLGRYRQNYDSSQILLFDFNHSLTSILFSDHITKEVTMELEKLKLTDEWDKNFPKSTKSITERSHSITAMESNWLQIYINQKEWTNHCLRSQSVDRLARSKNSHRVSRRRHRPNVDFLPSPLIHPIQVKAVAFPAISLRLKLTRKISVPRSIICSTAKKSKKTKSAFLGSAVLVASH